MAANAAETKRFEKMVGKVCTGTSQVLKNSSTKWTFEFPAVQDAKTKRLVSIISTLTNYGRSTTDDGSSVVVPDSGEIVYYGNDGTQIKMKLRADLKSGTVNYPLRGEEYKGQRRTFIITCT